MTPGTPTTPTGAAAKPKESDPPPRPLHKTCSLFMRNIAPNIAQAEIVAVRAPKKPRIHPKKLPPNPPPTPS